MKRLFIAFALLLIGCKYKFNDKIDCPNFHAQNVAVYKMDANTYSVGYAAADGVHYSGRYELVQADGCIVEHGVKP
jgi:hypothetical protein